MPGRRSGRTLVWVIVAATVVSFAANVLLTFGEDAPFGSLGSIGSYASPPRVWELTLVAVLEARLLAMLSRRMSTASQTSTSATAPVCGSSGIRDAEGTSSEEESERRLRAARHAEDAVAAGRDNVTTLDLTDRLCPDGVCRTDVGGRFRYRDGAHLSVPYVASLESLFAQKMQAAFSDLGRCEVS